MNQIEVTGSGNPSTYSVEAEELLQCKEVKDIFASGEQRKMIFIFAGVGKASEGKAEMQSGARHE